MHSYVIAMKWQTNLQNVHSQAHFSFYPIKLLPYFPSVAKKNSLVSLCMAKPFQFPPMCLFSICVCTKSMLLN